MYAKSDCFTLRNKSDCRAAQTGGFGNLQLGNSASNGVHSIFYKSIDFTCFCILLKLGFTQLAANCCQRNKFSANLLRIPEELRHLAIPDNPDDLSVFVAEGENFINAAKKSLKNNKRKITAEEFQNAVLDDDGRTVEQRIRDFLKPLGYHVEILAQDAVGFGCPQHRRRTIILFSRVGIWKHPQECDESKYTTAESAIGNLPPVASGQRSGITLHNGPSISKCPVDMLHGVKEGESPKQFVNADGSFPKKPKPKFVGRRNFRNKPWGTIVQKSASISGYLIHC
ncbi:MAG: DNA cytosine methyltransferase [Alphaproteobacteria bacterium]|nr:DNA cytosine methyltransferase [Alphaproteobacteria bacterium]MBQ9235292.1 DNA cytosine methyltransferase [Alphaproteobacteria bacterium]